MAGHKYRNPPIDEATCQFTLAEQIVWDPSVASRLFEHFKDRYPGMPSQQQLIQANLTPATGAVAPSLSIVPSDRIVFFGKQDANRLSVGPQLIGVHRTRPYNGFEEDLLPRIGSEVSEVLDVLDHEQTFAAVSVRYVNRIVIDSSSFDLEEYFSYWGASSAL